MGEGLLAFVRDDAYFKIFKAFAAGQHDLTKELLLSRLRKELHITDAKHLSLRQRVMARQPLEQSEYADEAPPAKKPVKPVKARQPKRERVRTPEISDDDEEMEYVATRAADRRPSDLSSRPTRPTKRLRKDSAGGFESRTDGPAGVGEINKLIGFKVQRYWPEYGGWWDGVITDFRNGEHCIVYDMNTPKESYEWYDISIARNDEFRVSKERINIVEHAQKAQPSGAPSRKPGGNPGPSGGRGQAVNHSNRGTYSNLAATNGHARPKAEVQARNGVAPPSPFMADSDSESTTSDSESSS